MVKKMVNARQLPMCRRCRKVLVLISVICGSVYTGGLPGSFNCKNREVPLT